MLFDTLFPEYYTTTNYSKRYVPYNLVKRSDTEFSLEFNVAGMNEDELSIEVQNNKLYVAGAPKNKESKDYIVNNIKVAPFDLVFTLKDQIEVREAAFKNGILIVNLELVIPEERRPKKILITH